MLTSSADAAGAQGEFKLTYFEDGLLPAAFMVGLLLSSPVFAEASKHTNAFRLLALGMGVWTLACLLCAGRCEGGVRWWRGEGDEGGTGASGPLDPGLPAVRGWVRGRGWGAG